MSKFDGVSCSVCKISFKDSDDVVVCPDCGTPHHRQCYIDNSACVNVAFHGKNFIWKNPVELTDKLNDDISNPNEAASENINTINQNINNIPKFEDFADFKKFIEQNRIKLQKNESERFEKNDIFGVSEREIMCFQSSANPFLIEKYRRIAEGRRISFNLMVLLLFPYITFYSRMRAIGIAVTLFDFLLRLPYTLLVISYDLKFMNLSSIAESIEANQSMLTQLNSFFSLIQLVFRIGFILFYDYIYLRWMANKIKEIRSFFPTGFEGTGEEYSYALRTAGKRSWMRMLLDSLGVICALLTIMFLAMYFFV